MTTPPRPWQNKQQQTAQPPTDTQEPIEFLEQLRPGGPWVLTAIVPDGMTETITAFNHEQVIAFVRKHNGKRNLYFSINPTRTSMTHKAAKTDIAAAEYLYADLDPRSDETPDIAKERYLSSLITHQPPPTVIIDSGNGLQCLWRLAEPVAIPNSVIVTDGKKAYKEDAQKLVEDLERRTEALMVRLGTAAGTQNIDRIFRLPGTINLPNKKKLSLHRVACPTKLLRFNANIYTLEEFPRPTIAEDRYPESQIHNGQNERLYRLSAAHRAAL